MSGGKGGSETTSVKLPKYLEDAVKANIQRGQSVAQLGYTPYYGPDVAAFTPMQEAAFANTGQAASAFGLGGGGMTGMEGMPQAQTFANGVRGYSSAPLYEQSLDMLQQNAPGQYEAIRNMFIDQTTGAPPSAPFDNASTVQKSATTTQSSGRSNSAAGSKAVAERAAWREAASQPAQPQSEYSSAWSKYKQDLRNTKNGGM